MNLFALYMSSTMQPAATAVTLEDHIFSLIRASAEQGITSEGLVPKCPLVTSEVLHGILMKQVAANRIRRIQRENNEFLWIAVDRQQVFFRDVQVDEEYETSDHHGRKIEEVHTKLWKEQGFGMANVIVLKVLLAQSPNGVKAEQYGFIKDMQMVTVIR